VWWDLKNGVRILDMGIFCDWVSIFGIFVWTQESLRNSFLKKISLLSVDLDIEYTQLMLVRLLILWLRRVVSPLTQWRVVIVILILFIILIRIRPIRYTLLVKVMKCQVSTIQIKRGQCEVWITIRIGIIVIIIHITKMSKTKNKQINKEKSSLS